MFSIKQKRTIYCERFSFKIAGKSCKKELKYCKFTRKRNKKSYEKRSF